MAGDSDVVKRVLRFKLQLTDSTESATADSFTSRSLGSWSEVKVLKILQKLKDLDITLDILAETGIGKTVNSLRRHSEAGDLAKSLVRGWKQLVPKKSLSHIEDGNVSDMSVKDHLDNQNTEVLAMEDSNKCVTSHRNNLESSTEHLSRITRVKKSKEPQKRKLDQQESESNKNVLENFTLSEKNALLREKMDDSLVSKENKYHRKSDCDRTLGNKNSLDKPRKDSKERLNSSSSVRCVRSEKQAKSKPSKKLSQDNEPLSESGDKYLVKTLKVKHEKFSGTSSSSNTQNSKRKKGEGKKHVEFKEESEYKEPSKPLNKKNKVKPEENESELEEPSMSFESYLNYDENFSRRKEGPGIKKSTKKLVVKEEQRIDPVIKPVKSLSSQDLLLSSKQKFKESVVDRFNNPLPTFLSDCEKNSGILYIEKKVQRESDCCDIAEDSAVFTGQRHYKKMQVYSGAKTVFLPSMMSLYQQCIRTLQNNINLLYETGGVPFEILEPVLERCTPEQLLRIEEYNPVYMGTTDHLWGKHCQRDFKDSRLQEYESWKEMYIRLSEERERKLQALTKTIVSAHSMKPKGRQVKMAFIHTVAKPPREVRIQQEIHGTAVQLPQLRCGVKAQESRLRSSNESSRPSNTMSGPNNTQDTRKKTRVAPIMAKSLRAFKKQLGRR